MCSVHLKCLVPGYGGFMLFLLKTVFYSQKSTNPSSPGDTRLPVDWDIVRYIPSPFIFLSIRHFGLHTPESQRLSAYAHLFYHNCYPIPRWRLVWSFQANQKTVLSLKRPFLPPAGDDHNIHTIISVFQPNVLY